VSIHDYGPPLVQTFGTLSIKAFKRDVDRAFDVFVFIFTARKDLDQLCPLITKKHLNFITPNRRYHQFSSLVASWARSGSS